MLNTTAQRCESCGYDILDQDIASNCPECGTLVSTSLPSVRVGTPWQRSASFSNWMATAREALLDPKTLCRTMAAQHLGVLGILQNFLAFGFVAAFGMPMARLDEGSVLFFGLTASGFALFTLTTSVLAYVLVSPALNWYFGTVPGPWSEAIFWHASAVFAIGGAFAFVAVRVSMAACPDLHDGMRIGVLSGILPISVLFLITIVRMRSALRFTNFTLPDGTLALPRPLP